MDGPVAHLHRSLEHVGRELSSRWEQLPAQAEEALVPIRRGVSRWWEQTPIAEVIRNAQQQPSSLPARDQARWTPMLASITMGAPGPRPQPVLDLAMAKDEVKARLAPVPVFTVANPKNEFVLVAGENNTQLGFFFFRKEDAEALIEKIREENPRLARDSKILRVPMDNVYEVFTTPRDQTGLQGIHFRFFPDMRQVSHALQLYKDAGVPTRQFVGVPVFQAEGLTVTTRDMQYVPLFLCKEDLDIAVQSAYVQRNAAQIKLYKDKADRYQQDFDQVSAQLEGASGRDRAGLESRAAKARSKLVTAREKVESVERAPLPKVEVGSFEEVVMRMTASSGNELAAWSQVMFVAPALLQEATKGGQTK
ncbi:Protein TIC 22-like, chloroplastic [Tetrabaena socialis]|uniref:Protein TIC 22-like, chloroplastic n=1 Tax=Tetrabaena socialis TaxID=47790 RepID=A0A2J7ZLF1_9CHLO|nr:Protein TIC 22-like, chloroplastic [Tetrabaena socialis]|eukprot:PNH01092.1 Protein TIC 22-like, chloroplastic [Tetrabaena socialis]